MELDLDPGTPSALDSAGTLAAVLVGTHLEGPSDPRACSRVENPVRRAR